MLTISAHDEYVIGALRFGASGFLLKDTRPADLMRGIRVVADGGALLSPSMTRRLIGEFVARAPRTSRPHPALYTLTGCEREMLALVAEGVSNTGIAKRLVISRATARTRVSRIMGKLTARNRAQLVVFAYESGIVD